MKSFIVTFLQSNFNELSLFRFGVLLKSTITKLGCGLHSSLRCEGQRHLELAVAAATLKLCSAACTSEGT